MKNLKLLMSLAATMLLLGSSALPQTSDSQTSSAHANLIAAARCQYTPADNACAVLSDSAEARRSAQDDTTLAQLPRRGPGRTFPTRAGYPPSTYPRRSMGVGNGRHAAIGAIIGFGLGAALGAKANKDQHPGATLRFSLLLGTFGAAMGALIAQGAPPFSRLQHPRGPWSDADEVASGPKTANPDGPQQTSAGQDGAPSVPSSEPLANAGGPAVTRGPS